MLPQKRGPGGGKKTVNTMPEGRCYTDQDCGDKKVCYKEDEDDVLGYCVTESDKEKIERNKKLIGESSENLARANMDTTKERIKQQQTKRIREREEEEEMKEQQKRGESREGILMVDGEIARERAERALKSVEDSRSTFAAGYQKDLEKLQKMKEEREKESKEQQDSISRLQDTITSNRTLLNTVEPEQNRLYDKYGITAEENISNACPVCHKSIDDVSLKFGLETGSIVRPGCCNGVFHKNCVLNWFNQATNRKRFLCPQCKSAIEGEVDQDIKDPKWVNMCIRLKYGNDSELIGDDFESSRSNVEQLERRENRERELKASEERERQQESIASRRMFYNPFGPGRPPDAVVRETLIPDQPRATGGWYSESSPNRNNTPSPPSPPSPPPVPSRPNNNERIDELERGVASMATNIGWRGLPNEDNAERWRQSHPFMPYTDELNNREIADVYGNVTYPMSQVEMRGNMTGRTYSVYYTPYDDNRGTNIRPRHVIFAVLERYTPTSVSTNAYMRGETINPMYLGIVSRATWNREFQNGDLDSLLNNTRNVNMNYTTYGSWVDSIADTELPHDEEEDYREMVNRMRNDERIRRRRLYIIIGEPLFMDTIHLFDGETHENIISYNNDTRLAPNFTSLHNAIGTMYEALYEEPDSSIYLETAAPAYTQAADNTYTRQAQAATTTTTPPPHIPEPFNFDGTITGDLRQMEHDGDVVHYQSIRNIPMTVVGESRSTNLVILEIEDGDILLFRQSMMDFNDSGDDYQIYNINELIRRSGALYGDMGRMELGDWLHDHDGQTEDSIFTRNQILDDVELNSTINELIRYASHTNLLVGGSDTAEDRYVFIYDNDITAGGDATEFLYIGRYNTFEYFRTAVMRLKRVILGSDSSDSYSSSSGMSDRSLGSTRASSNPSSARTPSIHMSNDFGWYSNDPSRTESIYGGYWPGTTTRVRTQPMYHIRLPQDIISRPVIEYDVYYTRLSMPPQTIGDRVLIGMMHDDMDDREEELHMLPSNYDTRRLLNNEDGGTTIEDIRSFSIPTTNPHISTFYGEWLQENIQELIGQNEQLANNYRRLNNDLVENRRLYVIFPGMMGDYIFDGESHLFLGQFSRNMSLEQRIESARSITHQMTEFLHTLGLVHRYNASRDNVSTASTVVGSAFGDASDDDNMSVVSDVSNDTGIGGRRKTLKKRKAVKRKSLKKRKVVKKKSLKKRKVVKKKSLKKRKVVQKKKQLKRKTKRNIKKKRRVTKKK